MKIGSFQNVFYISQTVCTLYENVNEKDVKLIRLLAQRTVETGSTLGTLTHRTSLVKNNTITNNVHWYVLVGFTKKPLNYIFIKI
jgi:hypothetical protein